MPVQSSIWGGNLGDTLWVTPLARYEPELLVWMRAGDKRAEATAPILRGLCNVMFKSDPEETPKDKTRQAHVTQQILAAAGHAGKPSVPRVLLTIKEIEWAIDYLKSRGVKGPVIAFINHNSGTGDPTNHRAHYVRPPSEVIKALARFWKPAGYAIVQFGPDRGYYDGADRWDPIPDAIEVRGLSVRELAACYHVIGNMIGGDTGDKWLMLAVGGKVAMLTPPDSERWGYRHWDLHLDETCWGSERPRVRYILHRDYTVLMDTALFDKMGDITRSRL